MSQPAVPWPPPRQPPISRRRSRGRLRRGDQAGSAMVEFALVIPVFLFVLYGLITYGVILAQKQQITNAAADAARSAVGAVAGTAGGGPVGETQAAAVQRVAIARVQASLGAQGNYTATATTASCSIGSGTCVTVNIVYDYANHPLVPNAPGLGLFTPSTFHSTAIVQYS